MKRVIIGSTTLIGVAFLTVLNINLTNIKNDNVDLASIMRIASASSELGDDAAYGGWDNFWQGQGFWLDEWPVQEPCPIYESSSGSGSASGSGGGYSGSASGSSSGVQINPTGRTDIRCSNGDKNCTSIDCSIKIKGYITKYLFLYIHY